MTVGSSRSGIVHTRGADYEIHVRAAGSTYRKVVFSPDGERLVGALFIGDITGAGMYRYVIREKMRISRIKSHIVNQTLHYRLPASFLQRLQSIFVLLIQYTLICYSMCINLGG